ncbi:MAG: hypothetical protein IJA78_01820 [Clostridia bacterium]|nr:hypothetical protein [Clostridia bacterium]
MQLLFVETVKELATTALAILIAALAIYLGLKLLGKLAKFVIAVVVIVLILWIVLSEHSILAGVLPF